MSQYPSGRVSGGGASPIRNLRPPARRTARCQARWCSAWARAGPPVPKGQP